jgi:hypothetical protein
MMRQFACLICVALLLASLSAHADAPRAISFQGKLTDPSGVPMPGTFEMTFRLWDAETGGTMLLEDMQSSVEVDDEGLYAAELEIPLGITFDFPVWLSVQVAPDEAELTPRYRLTSSPYAFWAMNAGMLAGNTIGDLDERFVNEEQANSITSGMIADAEIVDSDVSGSADIEPTKIKGTAWTSENDGEESGLDADLLDGKHADELGPNWTVVDSVLYTNMNWGIARGGAGNILYGDSAVTHVNLGVACTTGWEYPGSHVYAATIGGGRCNAAKHYLATVSGGSHNSAGGECSTIGGGVTHIASGRMSTVAGGAGNRATGTCATISGGQNSDANGVYSTVGGGDSNGAQGDHSTIAGGKWSKAHGTCSTIGGGMCNQTGGDTTTICGGALNGAYGVGTTICGGSSNFVNYLGGFVAGGYADSVEGDYSFVAGRQVRVRSQADYTFAFGRDFETSTPNAVIFHNSVDPIKVGIGTPSPTERLEVEGTTKTTGFNMPTGASDGYVLTSDATGTGTWQSPLGSNWTVTDSILYANMYWGLARGGVGNISYGDSAHTHVNLGVACTTGADQWWNPQYFATIGGGRHNAAIGHFATVSGGGSNSAGGECSTIGGGVFNEAGGYTSTVGGGGGNTAEGVFATVGGGNGNWAKGQNSTVAGGASQRAHGNYSTIAGGRWNWAYGFCSVIGGGWDNDTPGDTATVGGGSHNINWGRGATISGGSFNFASGPGAVVPGGYADSADGDYSFVAGRQVKANWQADHTLAFGYDFETSTPNAAVFYTNGTTFKLGVGVTDPTHNIDVAGGAYCDGTQWVDVSTRSAKKDIEALTDCEYQEVLDKLSQTEVVRFRYKNQEGDEVHMGVIAEDAPEELVDADRKGVPTGDAIGFLLAALKAQQEEIEVLKAEIESMKSSR